jgi:lipopolysaccharide/colanic/teichoic acid biosynthesis glycosyltransferase
MEEVDSSPPSLAGSTSRRTSEARSAALTIAPRHHGEHASLVGEAVSRVLNCAVALGALLLLAPLFIVTAIAVLVTSRGPIIYRQTRVGLDRRRASLARTREASMPHRGDRRVVDAGGKLFTIYKFRTMRTSAHTAAAVWASKDDVRVTTVGAFLRRTRLDELPQLVNVLKGDMNIVGPRPEQPAIFTRLRAEIDRYHLRQRAMPGITGWAQINRGYDTSIDDVRHKTALDLDYIARRSLTEDLRIMARTLPVMILRKGAH